MERKQIMPILIALMLVGLLSSTNLAQDLSLNVGADFVSSYIWRGTNVNNQPNVQPNITLKYAGLQMGLWGSYGLSHLNSNDEYYPLSQEIDTWLSYSFAISRTINVTALLTDYYFPNGGIKIGNFNNYDHKNGAGAHLIEAGLTVAGAESFPLSISGYINIHNDKGNNVYFQADYSTVVQEINIGLFMGAAAGSEETPFCYGTEKFNIVHMGVKVSKSLKISEGFSVPVYCSYILNPNREVAFLVLGISL